MLSSLVALSFIAEGEYSELSSMPAWVFGVLMFSVFLLLCLITVSYTNVYNKHADPVEEKAKSQDASS